MFASFPILLHLMTSRIREVFILRTVHFHSVLLKRVIEFTVTFDSQSHS